MLYQVFFKTSQLTIKKFYFMDSCCLVLSTVRLPLTKSFRIRVSSFKKDNSSPLLYSLWTWIETNDFKGSFVTVDSIFFFFLWWEQWAGLNWPNSTSIENLARSPKLSSCRINCCKICWWLNLIYYKYPGHETRPVTK